MTESAGLKITDAIIRRDTNELLRQVEGQSFTSVLQERKYLVFIMASNNGKSVMKGLTDLQTNKYNGGTNTL